MNDEQKKMLYILKINKHKIKRCILKTIKGQVIGGDIEGG